MVAYFMIFALELVLLKDYQKSMILVSYLDPKLKFNFHIDRAIGRDFSMLGLIHIETTLLHLLLSNGMRNVYCLLTLIGCNYLNPLQERREISLVMFMIKLIRDLSIFEKILVSRAVYSDFSR